MEPHEVWHVVVLVAALFGAAGLAIMALAPVVFEDGFSGKVRTVVGGLVGASALVLLAEWLVVH